MLVILLKGAMTSEILCLIWLLVIWQLSVNLSVAGKEEDKFAWLQRYWSRANLLEYTCYCGQ